MPYDNVTQADLEDGAQFLIDKGTPESEMGVALDKYAASLNASRAADQTSMFTKSLAVGADRLVASTLIGANEFLGGGEGMLTDAARTVKDWVNPFYEEHVAKAQSGQWWTNPDGWAASFGTLIPQVAEFAALAAIPTPGTKYAALAKGAGFVSKLTALATEAAPQVAALALSTTGDLKEAMVAAGVDEETASRNAKLGGVLAGAFYEPALALKFIPRGQTTEALAKYFAGQLGANAVLKGAAKEIGLTAAGGLSTMSGVGISNAAIQQAFNEMQSSNPDWKPPEGYTPQSLSDAFIGGSLLTGAMRIPQRVLFGNARERARNLIAQEGDRPLTVKDPRAVDQASILLPKEAQDKLASLIQPMTDDARRYRVDQLEGDELVQIANYVKAQAEPKSKPFQAGDTPEVLKNYVKMGLGDAVEGPYRAMRDFLVEDPDGTTHLKPTQVVDINTPIVNRVSGTLKQYGLNLNNAVHAVTSNPDILGINEGSDTQKLALRGFKQVALERSGLAPEIVEHLMNMKDELDPYDITRSLSNKLTADQYARFTSELEGYLFRDILKPALGERAANAWKPEILTKLAGSKFLDPETGKEIPLVPLRDFSNIPILNHVVSAISASFPTFRGLSDAMKINFVGLHEAMRTRGNQVTQMTATVQNHLSQATYRMTKWMREGRQQHDIDKIISHILTDKTGREIFRNQWFKGSELADAEALMKSKGLEIAGNVSPDTVALLTKAYDGGRVPEANRNYAKDIESISQTAKSHRAVYDLFAKMTGISMDQFKHNYLPRMWNYINSGKTVAEAKKLVRDDVKAIANEFERMTTERGLQSFLDLIDTADSSKVRMGDSPLSAEHQRMKDENALKFMKVAMTEDDPNVLMHLAMSGAIKKYYFEDMAPLMRVFRNDLVREANMLGKDAAGQSMGDVFEKQMNAYYNEYMGHTASDIDVSNKLKMNNQGGFASRMMDKAWESIDKAVGHKIDMTEKPTYGDMFQTFLKGALITTVGLPGNAVMPLTNYMQQSVASSIFGIKNMLMGKKDVIFKGKEIDKWISDLGLIVKEHPTAETVMGGQQIMPKRLMDHLTQLSMGYMDGIDTQNRREAAATAKYILEKVKTAEKDKGDKLSKRELGKILFATTIADKKVGNNFSSWMYGDHMKSLKKQGFDMSLIKDYADNVPRGFQGIFDATHDLYARGEWDQAQRFFGQSVIDSANFQYSQGGGVGVIRSSELGRHFALFMRFPSNWVSYMSWIHNPKNGMFTSAMRFWGSSLLIGGALGMMGVNANQELGFGPVPTAVKPFGPFARLFNNILGIFSTGAKALQGTVASPPEQQQKNWNAVGTAVNKATPYSLR